jgi:hypothetical protein
VLKAQSQAHRVLRKDVDSSQPIGFAKEKNEQLAQ